MSKMKIEKRDWWYVAIISALVVVITILSVSLGIKNKIIHEDKSYYDKKCEAFAVQNMNLSKGQIVFVGDSITDLFPLDDYFSGLDKAVYNRGISGDTTAGVLKRLEGSVLDLEPSKIVIMIGTNDINGGVSSAKLLKNYEEIITKIKEKLPNTEIYCISIIPQNEDLETYTTLNVEQSTERILSVNNDLEHELADKFGITYLDLFSLVADENNRLIKTYSNDGIHLNEAGFAVWANLIKPYLV